MKEEKENMPLVDSVAIVVEVYGAVCQLTRLWRHKSSVVTKYIYVLLHIVDNAGRHYIDFGRAGLIINDLSLFSY